MSLESGKVYDFVDGIGEAVIEEPMKHMTDCFWAIVKRPGHPRNGKPAVFRKDGKYAGHPIWNLPDLLAPLGFVEEDFFVEEEAFPDGNNQAQVRVDRCDAQCRGSYLPHGTDLLSERHGR